VTMPPDNTGGTSTGRDIDPTRVESTDRAGRVPAWKYGPPCGCRIAAVCVHRSHTYWREDMDMTCPAGAVLCGSLGIAERETAGRLQVCCRDLVVVA